MNGDQFMAVNQQKIDNEQHEKEIDQKSEYVGSNGTWLFVKEKDRRSGQFPKRYYKAVPADCRLKFEGKRFVFFQDGLPVSRSLMRVADHGVFGHQYKAVCLSGQDAD